jgi:hypothetical protein
MRIPVLRPFAILVVLFCAIVFPSLSSAQDSPPRAEITFSMSTSDRYGATEHAASFALSPERGQTQVGFLYSDPAGSTRGASTSQAPSAQRVIHWRLSARLVSTAVDRVTFDLDWRRVEAGSAPREAPGDRRTITLRQGQRKVLDFFRCPEESSISNLEIDVTARPLENEPNASVPLDYDLWLVHEGADGVKTTRRAKVAGRQSEATQFRFDPVALPLERGAADGPGKLLVGGTVTARTGQDGSLQVALLAFRALWGPNGGGTGGGSGIKPLTMAPGESVEIELPNGTGFSSWRAKASDLPRNPLPGVSVTGDRVRIDEKPYFAGARTYLILTIRPGR